MYLTRWVFARIGCVISAFLIYFFSCTSMYTMVAISIEKLLIVEKPILSHRITVRWRVYVLLACACLAFFWSTMLHWLAGRTTHWSQRTHPVP